MPPVTVQQLVQVAQVDRVRTLSFSLPDPQQACSCAQNVCAPIQNASLGFPLTRFAPAAQGESCQLKTSVRQPLKTAQATD